ncbi:BTAD domain-containing putative transcriptional regulator [Streptomyces sp. NPDC057245]|uniref:BTAD domain-containing putative transcriptional regulator n=1 Tax=Streptomyces TaxID=1883 RepID=UPI001C1E7108|nr:BTAD domain-containing putative transcriptional regulator [Streptomyces sp. A108]MBU6533814.1 AAA family ATPase [Streptomyces sp. A108]
MWFRILGPLEVLDGSRPITLSGTKQRATLGYLLLNANRVVPTRELLGALWPDGTPPTTARKILQNAVWGLRGSLAAGGTDRHSGLLLTKAPGYVMQVDRDQVDLHLFHRRIQEGRAALESGSPAQAAVVLRDALSLWHGQALSDLVESGINWPELDAAESARLGAMEDYFEAELRCGRHQSALAALESMVEAQPLRERLCGQLMLALYRCGRQADALNVYTRVRASLIEDLGLEPRRELQSLQQAILTQDATLSPPEPPSPAPELVRASSGPSEEHTPTQSAQQTWPAAAPEPSRPHENPVHEHPEHHGDHRSPDTSAPAAHVRVPTQRTASASTRRPVSVLLVKTGLRSSAGDRTKGTDELHDRLTDGIRDLVGELGGSVISSIGSTQLAVFDSGHEGDGHAERAVRAALAVRDEFHTAPTITPLDRSARRAGESTVHAAVSTGEALLRYENDGSGTVRSADGTLLDECQSLLSQASAGEVWVCGNTRQLTASEHSFTSVGDSPQAWKANRPPARTVQPVSAAAMVDREIELDVLRGMLERVRHRETPHVVTIVGQPGIGKSRLLKEFERRSMGQPTATWFLAPSGQDRDWCRTRGARPFQLRKSPLFDPYGNETLELDLTQSLKSGRNPLDGIARECPLIMFVDDLHEADNALLDFVGRMNNELTQIPLFVVATARPQLYERRPGWGGGTPHFTTISIDPPATSRRAPRNLPVIPANRPLPGLADCTP